MIYQDINFKICLSLFNWKENILPKQHIVQCLRIGCTFPKGLTFHNSFPWGLIWTFWCLLYRSNFKQFFWSEARSGQRRSSFSWGISHNLSAGRLFTFSDSEDQCSFKRPTIWFSWSLQLHASEDQKLFQKTNHLSKGQFCGFCVKWWQLCD